MTTTLVAPQSRAARVVRTGRSPWLTIAILGIVGGGVTAVGIGVPSFWGDEAASVLSAERPLSSLLGELLHVDAVHGLYYLFLHFWIGIAGSSETAVRFPSVVAAGFAVAGTAALGRELFGMRVAVIAGVAALAIPQLTRMAIEGRSYAFGMAAAVWLTWTLVRLVRRGEDRRRIWAVYGIGAGLSVVLFLYLALMILVHLVVLLAHRPSRQVVRRWLEALLVAALVSLPLLAVASAQQHQIAFLAHRHYATAGNVVVRQWFGTWYEAALAWTLIAAGALIVLCRPTTARTRSGALVVWAWLIVPTALLLMGNAWLHPMYNMRYVAFCVPAVALAIALGIDGLAGLARPRGLRPAVAVMLTAALLAAAAPTFAAQRRPFARDGGSDLRQIATAVQLHAEPGEAVIFDESTKPRQKRRLALDLYPEAFAGLDDIALVAPAAQGTGLWDRVAPLHQLTAQVLAHSIVWAVESEHSASGDVERLQALGYRVTQTIPLHRTVLYELTKEPS